MIKHTVIFLSFFSITLFADTSNWYGTSTDKKLHDNENEIHPNQKQESGFNYTGGYKQNENVSWEASYTDFGTSTNTNLEDSKKEESANSYAVGGKFSVIDKDDVQTNFKVGLHRWEQELDKNKNKGADVFYGVGMDIPITKSVSANTNYETFQLNGSNLDKMSIGITYRF